MQPVVRSGPVDLVFLQFPGNQFKGEIGPALVDLVVRDIVRVVDVLFVYKDAEGKVGSLELADLGPDLEPAFVDLDGQLGGGLLDADDVEDVGRELAATSSVAVVAVENVWATPFIQAVQNAGGQLVDQVRVPAATVDAIRQGA
jgi:hypothetical protein